MSNNQLMTHNITAGSRVAHRRFHCTGTVKQISSYDGAILVEWDLYPSKTDQWYTTEELVEA